MPKEKSRRRSSSSFRGCQRQNRSRTVRAEPSVTENQEERLLQQGYYPQSLNPLALVLLVVIFLYLVENFVELAGNEFQGDESQSNGQSHVIPDFVDMSVHNDSSFIIFYWYIFYFQVVFYQQ